MDCAGIDTKTDTRSKLSDICLSFLLFFKGWELLIHHKLTKYINRTRLGSSGKNEALKVKIDGPLREYRVLISLNEFLLLELD